MTSLPVRSGLLGQAQGRTLGPDDPLRPNNPIAIPAKNANKPSARQLPLSSSPDTIPAGIVRPTVPIRANTSSQLLGGSVPLNIAPVTVPKSSTPPGSLSSRQPSGSPMRSRLSQDEELVRDQKAEANKKKEARLASIQQQLDERVEPLHQTWNTMRKPPPVDIQMQLPDDWNSHGQVPGEKLVMRIDQVCWFTPERPPIPGTLVMTSYQLYFEPYTRSDLKIGGCVGPTGLVSVPLSTIERIEQEKAPTGLNARGRGGFNVTATLEAVCKDMRTLRFGFAVTDMCKRAVQCLDLYVFPNKDEYVRAPEF